MNIKYINLNDLLKSNIYNLHDIKNKYLNLLSMLTLCPDISDLEFINKIYEIFKIGHIFIAYIDGNSDSNNKFIIVGSGTIIYEPKIIRAGSYTGHIEDIVVHENYRNNGISQIIINNLIQYGKEKGCYKIILDCVVELENFYIKNGFEKKGLQMAKYF
jgi:glucosamine-phosphate N-acetyltransferase